jgi:hypothetical protein
VKGFEAEADVLPWLGDAGKLVGRVPGVEVTVAVGACHGAVDPLVAVTDPASVFHREFQDG